ncbi:peroxidase 1-like [Oryza glaberrima]|uniref:Peroxidase n=1 Tax=Oryza glaberrima TaxID=4538 RepID=I1R1Y4_ORYGL|nr:peroxidase 1-like [Oryza glaberrima]
MASSPTMLVVICSSLAMAVILSSSSPATGQLDVGFYGKTCPKVEEIVREEMIRILAVAPTLAGPLLRLHFHDCFVRGCDGSVLIDSTASNTAEKDAPPNQTLRGFGSVQRIKARLDAACPGTVSCADVLALMARDAVALSGGPHWAVPLGRRDGRVSAANDTTTQLPPPTANITQLARMFTAKGLGLKDLVVLSGGHTLGTAHCSAFTDRLYNFTGANNAGDVDPALDRSYLARLRSRCTSLAGDNTTLAEMDPGSFLTFDAGYYRLVARRRGLFHSDSSLLADAFTAGYVRRQATGMYAAEFFRDFAESMVKMGGVGVLTGGEGEIRKKCYVIN